MQVGYKGRSFTREIEILDDNDDPIDLTGLGVSFVLYSGLSVVLTQTVGAGVTVTDALNGIAQVTLSPIDTAALVGAYSYEWAVTDVGFVFLVSMGPIDFADPSGATTGGLQDMIAQVSPYTVGYGLPFSTALFNVLSPIAKAKLDVEDPGLPTALYDYCHALLIAHLYTVKRGGNNVKSKAFGNASVTKATEMTDQMAEYVSIIESYRLAKGRTAITAGEGVVRNDSDMTEMHLDGSDIPSYEDYPDVFL